MKKKDEEAGNSSKSPASGLPDRPAARRRRVLKQLAATGGVIVAGKSLPGQWTKPVVDSILMPAHAQATGGTITANWIIGDDAPGSLTGIPVGNTNAPSDFLYDDGTDMSIYGQVSPPGATSLAVNVNIAGTTVGGFDTLADDIAVNPVTGDFTMATFDPVNSDFGDTPGAGTISFTLSAPGYLNSVITLTLS